MLSFGHSAWLLLPIGILSIGLALIAYHRTSPLPTPIVRTGLVALRSLTLFGALGLLLSPACNQTQTVQTEPLLALLIDNSESMSLLQGDSTSAAQGLQSTLASLGSLPGSQLLFGFDRTARQVPTSDSLTFSGTVTDLSQGLDDVWGALRDKNLRGVLLMTDGLHNSGDNPVFMAGEYGVPIHTLVVGDSTMRQDLRIGNVFTNDVGYVDQEQIVRATLQSHGFSGQEVQVQLLHGDSVVATAATRLSDGLGTAQVEMSMTPAAPGFQQYTVSATHFDNEVTHRNNTSTVAVRVLDNRQRTLVLAASPSPDLASIRRFLEARGPDPFEVFVQKGPGEFYGNAFPIGQDPYELVILVGFPGPGAPQSAIQYASDLVESGTPLLFICSRTTDLTSLKLHFEDFLPVTPRNGAAIARDATVMLTTEGLQHPVLSFDGVNRITRLPPLEGLWADWQPTPDATILAESPTLTDANSAPLLVVRRRGGKRSAALLAGRTWRWENLPDDLEDASHIWPALLDGLIQWLTVPEDQRPVRINAASSAISEGDPIQLVGQVYDESLNPLVNAAVTVTVTSPAGETTEFQMQPIGSGQFDLNLGVLPVGQYAYSAVATYQNATVGTDIGTFLVGEHLLEYRETRADAPLLRQIATRSGGLFLTPDRLGALETHLREDSTYVPTTHTETTETFLWRWLPTFLVLLFLLTSEWVIRKRVGLA